MKPELERAALLLGEDGLQALRRSRVALFGLGGVGSYALEALARCGVGSLLLVDDDALCASNMNRQLLATRETIGKSKLEAARARVSQIDPTIEVITIQCFVTPENITEFPLENSQYILDAIDTVSAKLALIQRAKQLQIPICSCMGAGNKLDATAFRVADISKTRVCPLARVMRTELKKRGISGVKTVFSEEEPMPVPSSACRTNCVCPPCTKRTCDKRRSIPGSVSFVPSVAGLILAGEAVKDIIRAAKMHETEPNG